MTPKLIGASSVGFADDALPILIPLWIVMLQPENDQHLCSRKARLDGRKIQERIQLPKRREEVNAMPKQGR